jgi:hypothetical protein
MDWSTVVILAAVTLLDGVRRVPAGALVVRRVLVGQWSIADSDTLPGLRLVAWWNPFSLPLIIPVGGIVDGDAFPEGSDESVAAGLARTRRTIGFLRMLGAVVVLAIVFGIPASIARFDAWGLVVSLAAVMIVSLVTATIVASAIRRAGWSWRRAMRIAAPLLYPFTTPRAAELVLSHAVSGAAPLMVARQLLGDTRFAAWVRPQAYDAMQGDILAQDPRGLVALVGQSGLAQIVRTPPAHCGTGERYCARCARVYRAETTTCPECRGVPLVAHSAG